MSVEVEVQVHRDRKDNADEIVKNLKLAQKKVASFVKDYIEDEEKNSRMNVLTEDEIIAKAKDFSGTIVFDGGRKGGRRSAKHKKKSDGAKKKPRRSRR